jgi:hypothetical protein
VRLYHATSAKAAREIQSKGFRDSAPHWWYQHELGMNGVWLANHPVDENEGAQSGDVHLAVEVPEDVVAQYEAIEEGLPGDPELPPGVEPGRTWIVPAEVLNRYPVVVVSNE